jgi:RNA-directed DNA polymerase
MIRYADDIIVACKSAEAAESSLEQIREWMSAHGLTLHPEKTRIIDMEHPESHFDFLGYRFLNSKKGKRLRLVRPKSKKKFRDTIRPLTKRCNGQSMETIIARITPIMKG